MLFIILRVVGYKGARNWSLKMAIARVQRVVWGKQVILMEQA
jgi:hypothetical protein